MQNPISALAAPLLDLPRRILRCSLPASVALWRSRCALAALDDAQLHDTGITRAQADAEAARPVWDAPASWKY